MKVLLYWDRAALLVTKYDRETGDWNWGGYGLDLYIAGLLKLIDPFEMTRTTPSRPIALSEIMSFKRDHETAAAAPTVS